SRWSSSEVHETWLRRQIAASGPTNRGNAAGPRGGEPDGSGENPQDRLGAVSIALGVRPAAWPIVGPVPCFPHSCHWRCPALPAFPPPPGKVDREMSLGNSRRISPWHSATVSRQCEPGAGARNLPYRIWRPHSVHSASLLVWEKPDPKGNGDGHCEVCE